MVHYRVESGKSRFIVRAFATGLLSSFGHSPTIAIRDFSGEAAFSPDDLGAGSLRLTLQPGSLRVVDEISDKDRQEIERQMQEDVLETARYPQITFESRSISAERLFGAQYGARIDGTLQLHGLTHNMTIMAQVIAGEDALRANGEFSILQSDYGIKKVSALGGSIKLKDELKFSFDIVATRQA